MTTPESSTDKTLLPEQIFIGKLENLSGQKAIAGKRLIRLANISLIEGGNSSGDVVDYLIAISRATEIADKYLLEK